jgi:hypothetical protein
MRFGVTGQARILRASEPLSVLSGTVATVPRCSESRDSD